MTKFTIKRQNRGKTPTRYGIVTKGLAPRYKRVLDNNPVIKKYANDDLFLTVIFEMEDAVIKQSHLKKPYLHPETNQISTYKEVKETYAFHDWHCAYCKTPIKSRIDNYKASNFTCDRCFRYYLKSSEIIDQRVVESSVAFTQQCKKKMLENQKTIIKHIKQNEKSSKIL